MAHRCTRCLQAAGGSQPVTLELRESCTAHTCERAWPTWRFVQANQASTGFSGLTSLPPGLGSRARRPTLHGRAPWWLLPCSDKLQRGLHATLDSLGLVKQLVGWLSQEPPGPAEGCKGHWPLFHHPGESHWCLSTDQSQPRAWGPCSPQFHLSAT